MSTADRRRLTLGKEAHQRYKESGGWTRQLAQLSQAYEPGKQAAAMIVVEPTAAVLQGIGALRHADFTAIAGRLDVDRCVRWTFGDRSAVLLRYFPYGPNYGLHEVAPSDFLLTDNDRELTWTQHRSMLNEALELLARVEVTGGVLLVGSLDEYFRELPEAVRRLESAGPDAPARNDDERAATELLGPGGPGWGHGCVIYVAPGTYELYGGESTKLEQVTIFRLRHAGSPAP